MNVKKTDKAATAIFYIISAFVVLLLVTFIGYIMYKGLGVITPQFLVKSQKFGQAGGGIGPQLFNTLYLLVISLLITIPIGVGAGIYLSQYAKEGPVLSVIRLCIETLSSLPSIVIGLFGLLLFGTYLKMGYSLLSGAIAITILNLPSVTRVSENAITAASKKVKEASLGLGATVWQTISKVILPSAWPQIITGVILAAGRIIGEAAALLYTAGMSTGALNFRHWNFISKTSAIGLFRPSETLAVNIWKLNSEGAGILPDAARIANGECAVLIILVLIFNLTARFISKKINEHYSGGK